MVWLRRQTSKLLTTKRSIIMATQQRERNTFGSRSTFGESAKEAAEKSGELPKETVHKAGDLAKDAAAKAGEAVKETASRAGEMAQDLASRAGEAVKDAASTVAQKTGDAASFVVHKADDATAAVGQNVKSLAGTIREKGPHEGVLGRADAVVADSLESCGRELERGVTGMASDVTDTIRRHPVPAVLIGVGLGFLIARTFAK
jgi:ElaB/YqjD/DUF883 family membrane-anchored ribosome-binding protein